MKNIFFILFLFQFFLSSCQTDFVSSEWIEHNTVEEIKNPRQKMINDLMNNHLNKGMKRNELIKILGKPLSDSIMNYLPKNIKLPDSLKINYDIEKTEEERNKQIEKITLWYKNNYLQAQILMYPIGWSAMDPVFLKIRLSNEGFIEDFWIEQH